MSSYSARVAKQIYEFAIFLGMPDSLVVVIVKLANPTQLGPELGLERIAGPKLSPQLAGNLVICQIIIKINVHDGHVVVFINSHMLKYSALIHNAKLLQGFAHFYLNKSVIFQIFPCIRLCVGIVFRVASLDFFNCLFTTNLKDIRLLRQSIHYSQLANISRYASNYVSSVFPPKGFFDPD